MFLPSGWIESTVLLQEFSSKDKRKTTIAGSQLKSVSYEQVTVLTIQLRHTGHSTGEP